jgi:hypothetical protein
MGDNKDNFKYNYHWSALKIEIGLFFGVDLN